MKEKRSQLGFGTASLTSIKSYHESLSLLNCAYDKGITLFDTAPLYGKGYAELILGKFVRNKRSEIEITTKFGLGASSSKFIHPFLALPLNYITKKVKNNKKSDKKPQAFVPNLYVRTIDKISIENSLNQSLKNLQTDYIDNFMIHEGLPFFITEEGLDFLFNLKKEGVILNLGVAVNSHHLKKIDEPLHDNWDILQYDHMSSNSKSIQTSFPERDHYFHSILKNIEESQVVEVNDKEKAGYLLAQIANKNTSSKILFSTRKKSRLIDNIDSFNKFKN
ncbi:aldo/keto reductase family protein [Gramella sp. Hel_I_59]|uniref:aldo/keto reductase n=1 Tax=Gramella sp. Hel_I_59 TaxID=1249978 RepID=UPI001150480A|nr:aldo/keto reductase [Gramella sp. Hel_I_59]TQI71941.1 aldo/keto reductase family protein [Gramella sp. Hel_I_59]